MSPEKIQFDPSKLPLDEKRKYMKGAITRANEEFMAGLPDDTDLFPLFHKTDHVWREFLSRNFISFDASIITRTIGTVLRFDGKSGLATPIITLGQARGLDVGTLDGIPGIGEFQFNL